MISRWLLVFCVLAGSAAPAHAYLDPGTGSMMVQAIVAAAAAAIGGVSLSWRWIRSNVFRMIGKDESRSFEPNRGDGDLKNGSGGPAGRP
jgi:hypothetical protein